MNGPGKYDYLCTYVREQAEAAGAIIVVLHGNLGEGISVQLTNPRELRGIPDVLRNLANEIEGAFHEKSKTEEDNPAVGD